MRCMCVCHKPEMAHSRRILRFCSHAETFKLVYLTTNLFYHYHIFDLIGMWNGQ